MGTNSLAANAMRKAGAPRAATGENAVVVNCRSADIIVGPIGIVVADALLGEITPAMATAVCQSHATRVLIPVNHCENYIVGVPEQPISDLVAAAVQKVKASVPGKAAEKEFIENALRLRSGHDSRNLYFLVASRNPAGFSDLLFTGAGAMKKWPVSRLCGCFRRKQAQTDQVSLLALSVKMQQRTARRLSAVALL